MFLYAGKTGSGKSYGAVKNCIIPAIKAGRPVYTNVALNPEHFAEKGMDPTLIRGFDIQRAGEEEDYFQKFP